MDLLKILLISLGVWAVAAAVECIPETARCSKYWEKVLPHKDLMATENELDSWCSKQARFYQCLEDVLLEGKNGNLSYLPTNLLISKLFAEDLCSDSSTNRRRLLNNAECINQLNTDFCVLSEYLDIVTPDEAIPSTRCSQSEKTFSCIAATMVLNCGFDAARVYRTMLKITRYSDEVCGIEASEGIPPCESRSDSSTDRDKKLSEIYYGLFHRIGDILDQDGETEDSVSEEILTKHVVETMTEVIQKALDDLDKNVISEECNTPECLDLAPDADSTPCSKNTEEFKPYMKNPLITEVFKEFLFYNYSGIEYAVYWRQPLKTFMERLVCEHLQPSYMKVQIFRCRTDYRYEDPACLSNATAHEKVTTELIRSIDPEVPCDSTVEFGPRPEFMKKLDKMYEDKRIWDQEQSEKSSVTTEAPEAFTSSTLAQIATTLSPFEIPRDWYKLDVTAMNLNMPIPNELFIELMDLVKRDIETSKHPEVIKMKVRDSLYVIFFNDEAFDPVENFTCDRVDECHPNGRGLFKCKIMPRIITTCDTCGKIPTEDTNFGVKYASPKPRPTKYTKLESTTEPTETREISDVLESSTLSESIALVFSGDMESGNKPGHVNFQNEQADSFSVVNDEANFEEEDLKSEVKYLVRDSETDEAGFQILTSVLDTDEDSESSEIVYAIDNADDGESEVIIATQDGLVSDNILLVKRISDFYDE